MTDAEKTVELALNNITKQSCKKSILEKASFICKKMTVKDQIKEVEEIPKKPILGETFLIKSNGVSYLTHGIFKYPCKFIPHIPRWFLNKYSNETTKKYGVLDPFVGSGTSLVESSLQGLLSYGIDVNPLSKLLSKVKSTSFNKKETKMLLSLVKDYSEMLNNAKPSKKSLVKFIPEYSNVEYWFNKETINDLATIKYINAILVEKTKSKKVSDLLQITLASIIRKVSHADEQSPKPYISSKIHKTIPDAKALFLKNLIKYSNAVVAFSDITKIGTVKIIGYDARKINRKSLPHGQVHLAICSPPYINAFDYVRSLKLENIWLDLIDESNIPNLYDKQIGTERISAKRYLKDSPVTEVALLKNKLKKIYLLDKKRAYVVSDFFQAMNENLVEIHKTLSKDGYYCVVVGDSKIKGVHIPTSRIMIKLAEKAGYKLVDDFSYIIRNRYLRIPRMGRGGLIPKDYVLVFKK